MRKPLQSRWSRGFTLIEAMVTIAVLVVLLAVVAPSFRTFVSSQRVKTSSFDLYSTLMFARSEAIKRRDNVTIEAVSSDWKNGWTVKDSSLNILRSQSAPNGVCVTTDGACPPSSPSPPTLTSLTYRLDGRLTTGNSALTLAATVGDPDTAGRRCITVDTTGIPRSRKIAGGATCS
jgi:type IV fimbrial biogenesis protein FimT